MLQVGGGGGYYDARFRDVVEYDEVQQYAIAREVGRCILTLSNPC